METLPKFGAHCYMSIEEIYSIYDEINKVYIMHLKKYGVKIYKKLPLEENSKALALIFLYKYRGKLVHKDTITSFIETIKKDAGKDTQARHLGREGWYILNRSEVIPGTNGFKVPTGYHYFYDTSIPKPSFNLEKLKTLNRKEAQSFEELVIIYDNKCATCGAQEGKPHLKFKEKTVTLQKGHMNPNKSLTLENVIPQCDICNGTYQDNFEFDNNGYIKKINNPNFVLRSEDNVKKKIFDLLKNEYKDK